MQNGGGLSGISTGLTELDTLIGGLRPADLIIIAARPSMGKTALAVNIGMAAAKPAPKTGEMQTVAMFSLEMSDDQLAARVLADHTGVPSHRITRGTADAADIQKMIEREPDVSGARMFIDSTPAISVGTLRSRARRFKRQHKGLDLIIVDYLQLMRGDSNGRDGNRVQEVSEITRGLKAIAKELNVPVIALSQLSRQVESREDKRPQLSDLRESGSIEQDADIVAFIYREEYYLARAEPPEGTDKHDTWQRQMNAAAGRAEIIIAKNRQGAIGTAVVAFSGSTTRFSDLDMSQPRYSYQ
jgi:replicative DNA helicase